ncbi:MAG: hypothetical protein U9N55_00520 [candidate division Zixibacteria bacterium]|nr:hypothetical protein [candidate division Zixibacteria bacterium]
MATQKKECPLSFKLGYWWAFGLSAVFLIYSGVKIILSFLDHNYDNTIPLIMFGLIGLILLFMAYAYKGLKTWGWYGQIVINGLIILLGIIGYHQYENIILLVLATGVLSALFSSQTKTYLFDSN